MLLPDATGPLTHDIEGRPLTARYVVGRRVVGGSDEAFPTAEFDALAEATIGQKPVGVAARQIGGDAGRLTMDRRSGRLASLFFDKNLGPDEAQRIVGHELGHTIHEIAGKINTKGLSDELTRIYNDLNVRDWRFAEQERTGVPVPRKYRARPEDYGYKGGDVAREYVAEAIRAYMADSHYLKSVAPKTAAAIRDAVNSDPTLRKIIQFNSIAAAAVLPFVGTRTDDEGESWDPDRT